MRGTETSRRRSELLLTGIPHVVVRHLPTAIKARLAKPLRQPQSGWTGLLLATRRILTSAPAPPRAGEGSMSSCTEPAIGIATELKCLRDSTG